MASTDNKLFREVTAQAMLAEMVKQSNYLEQLTCEATNGLKGSSGAGLHNSFFRGKNLGSALTAAQSAAIRAGTFDDMFVGDYWPMEVTYTYKDANEVDRNSDGEFPNSRFRLLPEDGKSGIRTDDPSCSNSARYESVQRENEPNGYNGRRLCRQ